jgi:hypothetical protein
VVAQAVDRVIQLAEEGEVAFFWRRYVAHDFAAGKTHFLLAPLSGVKIEDPLSPLGLYSGEYFGRGKKRECNPSHM